MAAHPQAWVAVALALALALATQLWRQARLEPPAHGVRLSRAGEGAGTRPALQVPAQGPVALRTPASPGDPLLTPGLRHALEMLLLEAGEASEPRLLKQRLAGPVGAHFPAALGARALALAERYVDYRVALGALRAPQDPADPHALRSALQARQATRLRFFEAAEYDALFAHEDALDGYTLARMEAVQDPGLDARQRALALQAADALLPVEKQAEYAAITQHLAAAQQTAALQARNADPATRHAARSARWGAAAAQALAALDLEEQHWQQRLEQYRQALARQGADGAALQQLRQQLFSAEEQPRIDAALELRQLAAEAAPE